MMNDFNWLSWSIYSSLAMVAVVAGSWVGVKAGRVGWKLPKTLFVAAGRSALVVFATVFLEATVIAHYELRELAKSSKYVEWVDGRGLQGLKLDHSAWMDDHFYGHGRNVLCSYCLDHWYSNPTEQVYSAIARGFGWAFVSPVFCVLGMIPASIAATIAFNFGAQRRACEEFWRSQPECPVR